MSNLDQAKRNVREAYDAKIISWNKAIGWPRTRQDIINYETAADAFDWSVFQLVNVYRSGR